MPHNWQDLLHRSEGGGQLWFWDLEWHNFIRLVMRTSRATAVAIHHQIPDESEANLFPIKVIVSNRKIPTHENITAGVVCNKLTFRSPRLPFINMGLHSNDRILSSVPKCVCTYHSEVNCGSILRYRCWWLMGYSKSIWYCDSLNVLLSGYIGAIYTPAISAPSFRMWRMKWALGVETSMHVKKTALEKTGATIGDIGNIHDFVVICIANIYREHITCSFLFWHCQTGLCWSFLYIILHEWVHWRRRTPWPPGPTAREEWLLWPWGSDWYRTIWGPNRSRAVKNPLEVNWAYQLAGKKQLHSASMDSWKWAEGWGRMINLCLEHPAAIGSGNSDGQHALL